MLEIQDSSSKSIFSLKIKIRQTIKKPDLKRPHAILLIRNLVVFTIMQNIVKKNRSESSKSDIKHLKENGFEKKSAKMMDGTRMTRISG